jgi:hypothetical protein
MKYLFDPVSVSLSVTLFLSLTGITFINTEAKASSLKNQDTIALRALGSTIAQQTTGEKMTVEEIESSSRAKNLARQAAEKAKVRLEKYRVEDAMHGNLDQSPFVKDGNDWVFTIKGRQVDSQVLTIETVVRVSFDGKTVTVDYNGPIRSR